MKGRVAFITGASQGIGRACARALAEAGARLVLAARNQEKLAEAVKRSGKPGGRGAGCGRWTWPIPRRSRRFSSRPASASARSRSLVNNAGIARDRLVLRMKREDWDAVLATNLTGSYLCIQQVLPGMVRQRYGRIVNITSVVAQMGNAGQANYIASKAGLIGLTKAVAQEVASRTVTANAVAPGFIATPMTDSLGEDAREKLQARIPLRRIGSDRDVAVAVRFLASEAAGYITGQVLHVNGGLYMA